MKIKISGSGDVKIINSKTTDNMQFDFLTISGAGTINVSKVDTYKHENCKITGSGKIIVNNNTIIEKTNSSSYHFFGNNFSGAYIYINSDTGNDPFALSIMI